jgi:hypothetical protein
MAPGTMPDGHDLNVQVLQLWRNHHLASISIRPRACTVSCRGVHGRPRRQTTRGVGAALVAILGVVAFKESMTALKLLALALIIAGVVGLQLAGIQ